MTFLMLMLVWIGRTTAQDKPVIRLDMPSTTLQTGQYYDVALRIENAPKFWALDITLAYDPTTVYIMGTKAGSPITAGELFSGITAIVVKNTIDGGTLHYTLSKVGETAPAEGSGVIGTFRIYPLKSGTARMQFPHLQVVGLSSYDANATNVTTQQISAAPALLDLTITGDTVEAPSEATATPPPTETATQPPAPVGQSQPTDVPTLENIVFATSTPTALVMQDVPSAPANNNLSLAAIGLMLVAAIGLVVVLMQQRNKSRGS